MTLLTVVLAVAVGTLAVARAVRLVTSDAYPPIVWFRDRWEYTTATRGLDGKPMVDSRGDIVEGPWSKLFTCPFCFAPYAAAVDLTWAILARHSLLTVHGGWGVAWWIVNGWAAASYAAAMIVVRDEPVD